MADLMNREHKNVDAWAHQDAMRGIRFGDADKRIAHRLMSIKQSNAGYLEQPGEGRAIPRWPSGTQPCRSGGAQSRISAAR